MALHVVLPHLLLSTRPESFPRSLRTKERDAPSDSLPAGLDSLRRTPPAGSASSWSRTHRAAITRVDL